MRCSKSAAAATAAWAVCTPVCSGLPPAVKLANARARPSRANASRRAGATSRHSFDSATESSYSNSGISVLAMASQPPVRRITTCSGPKWGNGLPVAALQPSAAPASSSSVAITRTAQACVRKFFLCRMLSRMPSFSRLPACPLAVSSGTPVAALLPHSVAAALDVAAASRVSRGPGEAARPPAPTLEAAPAESRGLRARAGRCPGQRGAAAPPELEDPGLLAEAWFGRPATASPSNASSSSPPRREAARSSFARLGGEPGAHGCAGLGGLAASAADSTSPELPEDSAARPPGRGAPARLPAREGGCAARGW
mmetsp:Transcript_9618/g.37440  ORF Transcript_9618/g.37440 Transcript_9618/m.37440 type:complete len:312 (-) Transcript_9618:50-985(-)